MGSITDALKAKGATGSNIAECIETLPASEGGSSLPEVTSDDNGSVLKVVNGQWGVGNADKDVLFVKVSKQSSNDQYTSDYTFEEIFSAIEQGKTVLLGLKAEHVEEDYYEYVAPFSCMSNTFPGSRELCFSSIKFTGYSPATVHCYLISEQTSNIVVVNMGSVTVSLS